MAHRISHRNTPAQLESWRRQQQPSNDREYNVAEPLSATGKKDFAIFCLFLITMSECIHIYNLQRPVFKTGPRHVHCLDHSAKPPMKAVIAPVRPQPVSQTVNNFFHGIIGDFGTLPSAGAVTLEEEPDLTAPARASIDDSAESH